MNRSTKLCALLSLLVIPIASPTRLLAQDCGCDPCPPPCPPQTCTILVPQCVTEYQTRSITRYRPEVRQRMVTVYHDVPTPDTIQEEYTAYVPQKRMRTVVDTINHPVYGDIQLRTTAMTPEVDVHQGTETVTEMVAIQQQQPAPCPCSQTSAPPPAAPDDSDRNAPPPAPSDSTSSSSASTVSVSGAGDGCCNPCQPCPVCVTCWKPVSRQVKVQIPVTRFEPRSRLDSVSFYEYKPEKKSHKEEYVVQVPEQRTRTRQITVMRQVAEQQPERYTVLVPYQETIQVPVLTQRWVEQQVIVR
jgi:hypothetical protein